MDHSSYHQQSPDHEAAGTAAAGSRSGGGSSSYLCRQSSARWIPTGDQIRILRDLYYNYGVRSPSAEQIQRISAKLRQYGKIEGKNVFYWFQNHKARERQKKRLTADHISPSAVSSAANRIGSAPVGSYDGGQFPNGASLLGEKSFRSCCFPGGGGVDGTEAGMGWFGIESAFQVAPWAYHCAVGSQELVTPAAARSIETLPLFPIRAQEEAEEDELHKSFYYGQEENYSGYHQHQRSGGGGASLELTLNSCYYEPPSSM